MDMGKGFIVTVPNRDSEGRLLRLLKERLENYPISLRDPGAKTQGKSAEFTYPADWLFSSLDGFFHVAAYASVITLKDGTKLIDPLGVMIREATSDDLERFFSKALVMVSVRLGQP